MKNSLRLFLFPFLAVLLSLLAAPALGQETPAPQAASEASVQPAIAGRAALLINADDGQVLFSQNADERLPMASTTKMMTALIIVENHLNEMDALVTCSPRAAEVGESSIWLKAGEKLTVKEMITGLLVQSGNDAAVALAEFDAGSVEAFVGKMNRRAQELGLSNTHFANPHGLDDPGHYTTATDFAKLARELMKHAEIAEIVRQPVVTIPWPGQPSPRELINHNHLLGIYPAVNGIKTGYTDAAGQCIVISASENGTRLILVYLGGPTISQRDQDVINLLRFGFESYQEKTVIRSGTQYASIEVPFSHGKKLSLVSDGALTRRVFTRGNVDQKMILPSNLSLPVKSGDKVGLVEAYEGNKYLGSTYLIATEDVGAPGLKDRINYYIEAVYNFLASIMGTA